jgi:hypothetical protein
MNNEEIHKILAEIRTVARSQELFDGEEVGDALIRGSKILEWADRIEAAVKREMDEAAEFIDDYLREIPVYRPPHDWLIRNGYKDTSYQNDIFEDQNDGGAPAPDGAERGANGDTK